VTFDYGSGGVRRRFCNRESSRPIGRGCLTEGDERNSVCAPDGLPDIAVDIVTTNGIVAIAKVDRLLDDQIEDVLEFHNRLPANMGGKARSCWRLLPAASRRSRKSATSGPSSTSTASEQEGSR